LSLSWHSGQKECLIAGYEKSVEYDQRQEEEQFSFLNIHAWKIMSHRKEISHVHLITCYKAQEKVHSTHRKPQTDCKIGYFAVTFSFIYTGLLT